MFEKRDEWSFLRLRAAQLFEEGDTKAALRLMKTINAEQARRLNENRHILKDDFKIIIFQNGFGNDEAYWKCFFSLIKKLK